MATAIITRNVRGQAVYAVGSESAGWSWTGDRSKAHKFDRNNALRLTREYNATAFAADGEARVIDAGGNVAEVRETPAPAYNAPRVLSNALVSLTRRIDEGRDYANAHESACLQWGLTVAQGERLTAMYDAMCASGGKVAETAAPAYVERDVQELARDVCKAFVERSERQGMKGITRDRAALEFLCGAMALATAQNRPATHDRLGNVALLASCRGFAWVAEFAKGGK